MSDDPTPTPDGGDPNTVRELQRARADLTRLRAELKEIAGQRDAATTERDDAIKARDGYKGQLEKQKGEHDARVTELTEAAAKAKTEAEEALAGVRSASDRAVIEAEAKAAATRLGAHAPGDLVKLLDLSTVKRGEDGAVTGLDEVLTAAKEARGYMFGEAPKPGAQTGNTNAPPAPKPGDPAPFDARKASTDDYEAHKRQMLAAL